MGGVVFLLVELFLESHVGRLSLFYSRERGVGGRRNRGSANPCRRRRPLPPPWRGFAVDGGVAGELAGTALSHLYLVGSFCPRALVSHGLESPEFCEMRRWESMFGLSVAAYLISARAYSSWSGGSLCVVLSVAGVFGHSSRR